eukprot:6331189-Prymnesium_polylepis.1
MDDAVDRMNTLSVSGGSVATVELPVDCCAAMWKIWFDFVPCTTSDVEDQFVELHLVSMRLVSKTFANAFRACNGWSLCAQALRTERKAKMKQRMNLEFAFGHAHARGVGPLVCASEAEAREFHRELVSRMNDLDTRCNHITSTLLRKADFEANRLGLAVHCGSP